jgi:hypothetical protein
MNPFIAALPGVLVAAGVAGLMLILAPRTVRADDALQRLVESSVVTQSAAVPLSPWERAGSWLSLHLPGVKFIGPPTRDLDLLDIPVSRFYARKLQYALMGLIAPVFVAIIFQLLFQQPFPLPLLVSPLLGIVMWMNPDAQVRSRAAAARREFTKFVSIYLKLVAVALLGNTTPDRALTTAASVSDSWVFKRIRREFAQAELTRTSKWDAIERLGTQVEIPSLVELGRTMRLSEARVGLRDQLIAADEKLRTLVADQNKAAAERVTRRATLPVFLTLFPVIILGMLPAVFTLLAV